jgi:hypothetical protein
MRKMLIAGTVGIVFSLGATAIANASQPNPNVPSWSPYAIGAYGGAAQETRRPMHRMMSEGRSAYVRPGQPDQIFSDGSSDANHMFTPDSLNNSGSTTGGDRNEEPMADQ